MRPYLLSFALSAFALPASSQQSWSGSLSLDRSEALGDEFGGGGSLGVSASVYRSLGARIALGLELGHTRFGSNTSILPDAVGRGTVLTEEYGWSAWHAAAVARIRLSEAGFARSSYPVLAPTGRALEIGSRRGTAAAPGSHSTTSCRAERS